MYQISDAQLSRIFNLSTSPRSMAPPSPLWPSSTSTWHSSLLTIWLPSSTPEWSLSSTTIWSTTSTAASQSITSLSCKSQICRLKFYDVTCLPSISSYWYINNEVSKLISLLIVDFWRVVLFYCQQIFVPGFESHFIYFFWYQSVFWNVFGYSTTLSIVMSEFSFFIC